MVLTLLACAPTVTIHLRSAPTPAAVLHSKLVSAVTTLQVTEYFVPLAPPYVADTQPLLQVEPKFVPTMSTMSPPPLVLKNPPPLTDTVSMDGGV